jgi:ubiquitin-protein ligase E3 C
VEPLLPEEQRAVFIYKALVSLLRLIAFFFNTKSDQGRLSRIFEMVLFSGTRPAASNFLYMALADDPQRRSFLVLFERLLSALLLSGQASRVAQLLQLLWKVLSTADTEKGALAASHLLRRTASLQALTREAFFIDQQSPEVLAAADLVLLSCLGISAAPAPHKQELAALLLSTPALWQQFAREPRDGTPHLCIQRIGEVMSFSLDDACHARAAAILDESVKGGVRWAWLIGNLSTLLSRLLDALGPDFSKTSLWLSWLTWCKDQAPAGARDDVYVAQINVAHGAELARALLRCVDELDSRQLLPVILQFYFPTPTSGIREDPPLELLQVLAFGTSLVQRLYPSISMLATSPNLDLTTNPELSLRLRAFCAVYVIQLQSMYDAEFFGPANPLRPHEVAFIVPALNRLAYKFVTENAIRRRELSGASLPAPTQLLGKALTALVRALYHRHLRKPIVEGRGDACSFLIPEAHQLLRRAPVVDLGTDETSHNDPMDADSDAGDDVSPSAVRSAARARTPAHLGGDSASREVLEAVLDDLPHVLPFQSRVALLHNVIEVDQANRDDTRAPWVRHELHQHQIRRDRLVEDGFAAFLDLNDETALRAVFKVEFIAPDGEPESGIDGGGLFKEFMIHICRETFDPKYGLFAVTDEQTLYPSPSAFRAHHNAAELYRFLGKVVGKAVYERFLLEAQFSRVFLNRILGRTNEVDDVAALDKELHRGMLRLKENSNVDQLGLTFSISTSHLGHVEDVDLIPNGRNIPVTSANLTRYLHVVANFRTNLQIQRHTAAFVQGLQCVVPLAWLKMFDPYELNMLISGSSTGFDVEDLRRHTVYGSGYNAASQPIQWLWQLLRELDSEDMGRFLMFTTSCSRPPLLGFETLCPNFAIHLVPDAGRLPTASTCANLLKLPNYGSFAVLKAKVMDAIRADCGFDLS